MKKRIQKSASVRAHTGWPYPPAPALQHGIRSLSSDHHGWLQGWLRRNPGCAHCAADLAHDTFVRQLTSSSIPAQLKESRGCLATVARHVLLNHQRW